jgi:altronate dehydratase
MNTQDFLLLDPTDNVLVARVAGTVPLGHKIARTDIRSGDKILKYGAPIGVATADIPAGAHVHVHNIRSDYTPTYTLDAAKEAT